MDPANAPAAKVRREFSTRLHFNDPCRHWCASSLCIWLLMILTWEKDETVYRLLHSSATAAKHFRTKVAVMALMWEEVPKHLFCSLHSSLVESVVTQKYYWSCDLVICDVTRGIPTSVYSLYVWRLYVTHLLRSSSVFMMTVRLVLINLSDEILVQYTQRI